MQQLEQKDILEKWDEIKTLIESMDLDVKKNLVKSNQSAGLRSRRGFRLLKKMTHELLMQSVAYDKQLSTTKKEEE